MKQKWKKIDNSAIMDQRDAGTIDLNKLADAIKKAQEDAENSPSAFIDILDKEEWTWAEYRAESLGFETVSEYVFDLIKQDRQQALKSKHKQN